MGCSGGNKLRSAPLANLIGPEMTLTNKGNEMLNHLNLFRARARRDFERGSGKP
jgi:hypothetical protein